MPKVTVLIAIEPLHKLESRHFDQIQRVAPDLVVQVAHNHTELIRLLGDIEVLATLDIDFDFKEASRLKWVQWWGAGVDHLNNKWIMQHPVLLTNASGIHGKPIAEYVLSQMVSLSRGFPEMFRNQVHHRWGREDFVNPWRAELRDHAVVIVGYGSIGKEIARLSLCFGMHVKAVRRSTTRQYRDGDVDVLPVGDLNGLLAVSDFVVLSLPYTHETKGFIGEKELMAMKPSSYLINIARGQVVDEVALIKALREKRIAGAALDTVVDEPLSPQSELWDLPNVTITPHISADTDVYNDRATSLFCENLARYLGGQELLNIVEKDKGY